jgi:hypothetical protein
MAELTTQELLEILRLAGLSVSQDQLKYWRRNGLLPIPRRRGMGRGMGIEQLWDDACVENVRLILESSGGKRVNLMAAGHYLFARNRPIGETLLRRYLLEIPAEMRKEEKPRTKNAQPGPEFAELIRFLTPNKVKKAIDQTDAGVLIELYNQIEKSIAANDNSVFYICRFHSVFDLLVETEFPDISGNAPLSDSALYRRQRSTLAWAVLLQYYDDSLNRMISTAIHHVVSASMLSHKIDKIVYSQD